MAEEKSIGTILGELYLDYIKTTNAASMSRVGAPNIAARPIGDEHTALIDFFNSQMNLNYQHFQKNHLHLKKDKQKLLH